MEGAVDATELMAWEKYTPFFINESILGVTEVFESL